MGSHGRHRLGNSWSAVTGSFTWGVYLNLNTSSENMNSHLMSVFTSSCSLHLTTTGGYIWQLICTLHLKIWTHIWCLCALHLVHFMWQLPGGISDSLSVHFIWKYELISGLGLASQRSFLRKTNRCILILCSLYIEHMHRHLHDVYVDCIRWHLCSVYVGRIRMFRQRVCWTYMQARQQVSMHTEFSFTHSMKATCQNILLPMAVNNSRSLYFWCQCN